MKWEEDAGSIEINGTDYLLQQAHWHSPSEHTLNGRRSLSFFLFKFFQTQISMKIEFLFVNVYETGGK